MSEQAIYANPFLTLAGLLRGLRLRYVAELGLNANPKALTPAMGEVLGSISSLITECEDVARLVDGLERTSPGAFEAFQRAQEKA